MGARVGIAMAVYNDERYLPLALDSLCRQQFRDFDLVVLDDGSTDASATVVDGYADRLPLRLIREQHAGRQLAKQASRDATDGGEFLMVLDSDIALPEDALARMVAALDGDPSVAAVSLLTRADAGRPYGAAQAFMDDLFFRSNTDEEGNSRWIVGGCALFRRSALAELDVRTDVGEDNDLSEKLRKRWRLVLLRDVAATHYGVPTTARGVLQRFAREGVRVRALLRVYPEARQLGNVVRLLPLPLATLALGGVATGQWWLTGFAGVALGGYLAAFLYASRGVPARPIDRVSGALLFTFGNLGFALGYAREALRGNTPGVLREPRRNF